MIHTFTLNFPRDGTNFTGIRRKSSNVQPGYVEYMKVKYGENSNVFRIRVEGEPPIGRFYCVDSSRLG